MYAKNSLGQHFLKSESALSKIIEVGDPKGDDLILEIGPGEGVLTERLLKLAGKVIAVEKDDRLFEFLKEKFSLEIGEQKLELIHGDILEFDQNLLKSYKNLRYKIIANIPYNLTGAILEKFLSAPHQPESMVLLLQKEVAERIVAREGKESILSLSVKAYGKPRYVQMVKAGSFAPMPSVDSAILSIEDISRSFFRGFTEKTYFRLVKAGFSSKRKKLSSNLSLICDKNTVTDAFQRLKLDENLRAEDLRVEKWGELAQILENCLI